MTLAAHPHSSHLQSSHLQSDHLGDSALSQMPFADWMAAIQASVEQDLQHFLPSPQTIPTRLHEAMHYATLDGGKRVRPLLVFAAGALFNAPPAALAHAACAVEMVHAYSLVHDDMPCMDDDALRRGKPTVHKQYDQATALLVGDALQAQAFDILTQAELAPALGMRLIGILAKAAGSAGMCGGQAIDLSSVGTRLTLAQLEHMHQLKTGALLRAAVLMGANSAGALPQEHTEALSSYAKAVGLAFQVVDDVLDVTADSATLGKTAGKDAEQNKPTYVSILGLAPSERLAEQLRQAAHAALLPFGAQAQRLRELADFIVYRKT